MIVQPRNQNAGSDHRSKLAVLSGASMATLPKLQDISHIAWDFDGTLVFTEHLHRMVAFIAVREVVGDVVKPSAFARAYRDAFNIPSDETNRVLAGKLRENHPQEFAIAVATRDNADGAEGAVPLVAQAIAQSRRAVFDFFVTHATLQVRDNPSTQAILKVACSGDGSEIGSLDGDLQRRRFLSTVTVYTYPHVIDALKTFKDLKKPQGICTSSHRDFVLPLLRKLELEEYFNKIVSAEQIPDGYHKPHPRPWQVLRQQLQVGHEAIGLTFENSAGGARSALVDNKGPVVVVPGSKIGPTIGKLAQRVRTDPAHSLAPAYFDRDLRRLVGRFRGAADPKN